MLFQRALQIMRRRALGLSRIINCATRINEAAFTIENIKVRCPESAVSTRHVLRFVLEINAGKLLLPNSLNHVREIILSISIAAVGGAPNKTDTAICKSLRNPACIFV